MLRRRCRGQIVETMSAVGARMEWTCVCEWASELVFQTVMWRSLQLNMLSTYPVDGGQRKIHANVQHKQIIIIVLLLVPNPSLWLRLRQFWTFSMRLTMAPSTCCSPVAGEDKCGVGARMTAKKFCISVTFTPSLNPLALTAQSCLEST